MPRLAQIIAAEGGHRSRTLRAVTDAHQRLQKVALSQGLTRTYQPKNEEGEALPSEHNKVQVRAELEIAKASEALASLFDVTFTKDAANQQAAADITVDGVTLVSNAPVSFLLFLEKQIVDLSTFVSKIPVLDPSETWTHDVQDGLYKTAPVTTHRTKKVYRNHVKAEATDRHPAQVEVYTEDETVGYWTLIKHSGAVPQQRVVQLQERLAKLSTAVKHAREEANSIEVTSHEVGQRLLDWVFSA